MSSENSTSESKDAINIKSSEDSNVKDTPATTYPVENKRDHLQK